jgi:ankyrin repeat protein
MLRQGGFAVLETLEGALDIARNGNVDSPVEVVPRDGETAVPCAINGDVQALGEEISKKREVVNNRDENGWQPIHENAAGGHKQAVELLVNNGTDINTRALGGQGGTPLHIAKKRFGPLHPVEQVSEQLGYIGGAP